MMLRTRHWRSIDPLLFEVEKLAQPDTLRWAILKHLQGNFLMRAGRYDRARAPLLGAYEAARRVSNPRLESIVLRDLAVVLHHAGSVTEGIEFMKHAVELAEDYSGVWSLWNTYEAAARLLTDRRIVRLARQARAAISARASASHGGEDHALGSALAKRVRRSHQSPESRLRLTIGKADPFLMRASTNGVRSRRPVRARGDAVNRRERFGDLLLNRTARVGNLIHYCRILVLCHVQVRVVVVERDIEGERKAADRLRWSFGARRKHIHMRLRVALINDKQIASRVDRRAAY